MVQPVSIAGPGEAVFAQFFSSTTELLWVFFRAISPALWQFGGLGKVSLPRHHLQLPQPVPPRPTTSWRNEALWERKKKKYLWGLAFWGFIPIKTETGLQSQQKALACQTAGIRLSRIYGVCGSPGGAKGLVGR